MTDKKPPAIRSIYTNNVTPIETDQEDLAEYFEGMAALARQGKVIGMFGCAVMIDSAEECSVAPIEEGFSMSEADVIQCLKYVVRELEESWEADFILKQPD